MQEEEGRPEEQPKGLQRAVRELHVTRSCYEY